MALQDNSSATTCSPQQVAAAFVNQYYQTLRNSPEHVHRFYTDSSTLGREDSNGVMTSVTTIHGINSQITSTDYTSYVIELQTVDAQTSHVGGVLILVTGSFTTPEAKKKFTQSFFLAPQGHGAYFVLNDMFRFVSEIQTTLTDEVLANHDNKSTQTVTLPAESETASAHEGTVNHVANGVSLVKNDTGDEERLNTVKVTTTPAPAVKVATTTAAVEKAASAVEKAAPAPAEVEKLASAVEKAAPAPAEVEKVASAVEKAAPAPAPAMKVKTTSAPVEKVAPASAEKSAPQADKAAPATPENVKRTYASIVKVMSTLPAPAPAPTVKSKPSPRPKTAQNAEKSATTPPKPVQAINAAPQDGKNIPKSKQPDEPGYSIFVKNLPYNATAEMVEQEFRKFGVIKPGGIQVRYRQMDGFCFGFVEFESQHSMQEALEAHSVYIGSREAYIEEKRTTTRVVNGVITRGDDNGNAGGSRFQSGRGGYHQGDNFRGRGEVYRNNGNYRNGDNMRNGYRNDSGRGQGLRGNGYYQIKNSYHQNGNGYHQNGNQQRRPSQNSNGTGNGKVERANGHTKQTPAAA